MVKKLLCPVDSSVDSNAALQALEPVPALEPDVPRCKQCGEALEPKPHRSRPINELCVDCAFDTLPCTD